MNRRTFLKRTAVTAGTLAIPRFISSPIFGQNAPSNRITLGCIGVGRMGMGDVQDIIRLEDIQITAVCDLDSNRMKHAQSMINDHYRRQSKSDRYDGCHMVEDYRDLISKKDIDAVMICTPDHWHAPAALRAARAGKDIFMQKPLTYTLHEGRQLSDTIQHFGNVFQVGSQQRSDSKFRLACELVRNGRIGQLMRIEVGMGVDPGTVCEKPMPVPKNLNYDMWQGPTPYAPYTEKRVHPKTGYGRPGWLRITDYCLGMITGWGAHHLDIAQWAMGLEHSGPIRIKGKADYPTDGLWDVHGLYDIDYEYSNGVKMNVAHNEKNSQGVRFIGTEGWIYVRRGFIESSPKSLLTTTFGQNETRLYYSNDHKRNFVECIKTRKQTVAPVEDAHRSCSACILGHIAMQTGLTLNWNPEKEQFINSDVANRMLYRAVRKPEYFV